MTTAQKIRKLLSGFFENYKQYGNVWGVDPKYLKIDEKQTPKGRILFFSADFVLSAVKEILLQELGARDFIDPDDIFNTVDNFDDKLFKDTINAYQRIIDRLSNFASRMGFSSYIYPYSLGIEFFHWGHKKYFEETKTRFLDTINHANEIIVYSPIEYLVLQSHEKNKVKYFFDLNFQKQIELPPDSTYQESCIITRHLGKTRYWHSLINSIPLVHPLSGNLTSCCGEFIWYLKPRMTILNAYKRLKDFENMTASKVYVSCPSALAIFRATTKIYKDINIEVKELSELLV